MTSGRPDRRGVLLVLLLAVLCMAPSLGNGFVYDDHDLVEKNPLVTGGLARIPDHFTHDFWGPTRHPSPYYRPLVTLSLLADATVWGMRPVGYHAQNVLWHLVATGLVLAFLARLVPGSPRAVLVGGALFAVHPIHTQSVAWIAGRTDLIATVAVLGAILAYLRYREAGRPRDLLGFGLVLGAGFLAKETVVTGVGILVVVELVLRRRARIDGPGAAPPVDLVSGSPAGTPDLHVASPDPSAGWTRPVRAAVVTGALLVALFVVRRAVLGTWVGLDTGDDPTAWWSPADGTGARLLTVGTILLFYLSKLVLPVNLSLEDGITLERSADVSVLAGFALVAALTVAALVAWRRSPRVTLGLVIVLLPLAPVSNVLPLYQPAQEHFLYLPSVGLCLLAALGVARVPRSSAASVLIAVAVLALGTATAIRCRAWTDDVAIWSDAAQKHPHSSRAQVGLATAFFMDGRPDSASTWIDRALHDHPDHFHATLLAGVLAEGDGRRARADSLFARAHRLHPSNRTARYNHGRALVRAGRHHAAIEVLDPLLSGEADADVLFQAARAYGGAGELERAIALGRRVVALDPERGAAWLHLATWLEARGKADASLDAYERARALAPRHAGLAFTVARAEARAGRLDAAWTSLTAAVELGLQDTTAVDGAPELAPLRDHPGFAALRARMDPAR